MSGMTARQQETLVYIKSYIAKHGYSPSCADIAGEFSITRKTAHDHVKALARRGIIKVTPFVGRSIIIVDKEA